MGAYGRFTRGATGRCFSAIERICVGTAAGQDPDSVFTGTPATAARRMRPELLPNRPNISRRVLWWALEYGSDSAVRDHGSMDEVCRASGGTIIPEADSAVRVAVNLDGYVRAHLL